MPSQPFGEESLATVLSNLQQTLHASLDALKTANVAAELQGTLHDDTRLPDKAIASLASGTVDLLAEVEQLLQPAHLVLADHFLGMLARHH